MKNKLTVSILAMASACFFALGGCADSGGENSVSEGSSSNSQGEQVLKTDEEKIRACIEQFEKAYNDGDFEAVLECMDQKTRNTVRALFNTLGGIMGGKLGVDISLSDLFSLGVGINDGDFIGFDIQDVVISDKKATVTARLNLIPATVETTYVILVEEDGEWLIENITDKKSSIGSGKSVTATELGEDGFVDGIAKITYERENQEFWGLININGDVIYTQEGSWNRWNHIGNGVGWISKYDDNTETYEYQIINSQGEVVASSANGEFDQIICAENGLVWVYKYQSGINGAKAFYGVMDGNGEWVAPMTQSDIFYSSGFLDTEAYMLGEDYFVYDYYGGWRDNYIVYNYKTGNTYKIENGQIKGAIDDLIYGCGGEISYDEEDYEFLFDYYRLKPDGTIEELSEFTSVMGDWLVLDQNSSSSNVVLRNVKTKEVFEYTAYASDRVLEIVSVEGGFLVQIQGLDGNKYFTLLDKDGNQRFEPIKYYEDVFFDEEGLLVYRTGREMKYAVVNVQGEVVVPESAGYCYISTFSDGLAVAQIEETEKWVIIDAKGNVVVENFYVKE